MGGMGGEIRGKTKLETYKRFRARVDRKKIEDKTGLHMDAGTGGKPEVYEQMKKDPRQASGFCIIILASNEGGMRP